MGTPSANLVVLFNRGWDPRSKIVQRSVGRILDPDRNRFNRFKFQSGMGSKIQDCPEVCWQNLGSRLKPIEPIEISIGTKSQDPRSKIPREDP